MPRDPSDGPPDRRRLLAAGAWALVAPVAAGAVVATAAAGATPARAQPGAELDLPLRNLLVELRESASRLAERDDAGLRGGSVVIGSDGSVRGDARLEIAARTRDRAADTLQQLRVLNGGRGSLRLSRAVPLQFYEVQWSPRGAQLQLATLWTEAARGLVVQPRWPGGDAPVRVELQAEAPGDAGAGGGLRLLTTLQLPLGEWVTVARTAQEASAGTGGGFGTGDLRAGEQRELQLRVTAP